MYGNGGIFSDSIITNVLLILTVKRFEYQSIFDEVIRSTKLCHFWATIEVSFLVSTPLQLGYAEVNVTQRYRPTSLFASLPCTKDSRKLYPTLMCLLSVYISVLCLSILHCISCIYLRGE